MVLLKVKLLNGEGITQDQLADNLSEQMSGVDGDENDADQYSHNYNNQDQVGEIGDVHQDQLSTNTTGQGTDVVEMETISLKTLKQIQFKAKTDQLVLIKIKNQQILQNKVDQFLGMLMNLINQHTVKPHKTNWVQMKQYKIKVLTIQMGKLHL